MARVKGMKKQKHLLFFIDILTAILLIIHIQSTIALSIEYFSHLKKFLLRTYFSLYTFHGIAGAIYNSPFRDIYPRIQFIVFCFNIYAAMVKLKDIHNKELVKGIYRYFLIFNVVFVVLKIFEFYFYLDILTHA